MKFVKSNFAKKLIIVLVILMIFNFAIPKKTNAAWNFSGILMKPICSAILGLLVSVDVTLGVFMLGIDLTTSGIGNIVEEITEAEDVDNLEPPESLQVATNRALSNIFIGPDTIFTGGVSLLNANIFKAETEVNIFEDTNAAANSIENIGTNIVYGSNFAGTLKKGISTTYVILRNICAMLMLAGLIFTGIRVLVTSNMPNKAAQWRQLVFDWLVGMILLIFSHVIMYGIFWFSDELTKALSQNLTGFGGINFTLVKQCLKSLDRAEQIVCLVMLGYLIYLTIVFALAYFKRLMWICVLIVIAPIVSIMYAFGNQTKQIYSKWMKEYIMTVLVQPFHLIIYYTLVSVPLNMVSNNSLFEYAGELSIFKMIYALGAIAFIRPAEKYIRELFGFHQGIAGEASFDGGKKIKDAVGDSVKALGEKLKKVAEVALIVATAGAGAPAVGAIESTTAVTEVGTDVIPEVLGGAEPSLIGEMNPDNLLADDPGMYDGFSKDSFQDDFYSGDQFFDDDLQGEQSSGMNKKNEQEWLDNGGYEKGSEERAEIEENLRAAGHGDNLDEITDNFSEEELEGSSPAPGSDVMYNDSNTRMDELLEDISDDSKEKPVSDEEKNIKANNVIIEAGNVNMQENNNQSATNDNIKTAEEKTEDNEDSGNDKQSDQKENEDKKKKENEENIEIEDEGTPNRDNREKDVFFRRRLKESNAFMDLTRGEIGIAGAIERLSPDSILGKMGNEALNTKGGQKLKAFEEIGGLTELHKGFNTVRDAFFVGSAPGDWKTTNNKMAENDKKRQEQTKFNVTNEFKDQFTEKYFLEYKEKYKEDKNYSDARLMDMAKDKAESKLKSLTDTYVPLGITDANVMLELEDDRKKYGLSAENAISQRANYEKFNVNVKNVETVNGYLETNNSTIQQSIPEARDYYNNGYTNAHEMARAHELTELLGVSHEYGMKLDKALKNKGSQVNLNLDKRNDLDDKQKERIKTVLDSYSSDKE